MAGRALPGKTRDGGDAPVPSGLGCLVVIGALHGLDLTAEGLAHAAGQGSDELGMAELAASAERAGFRCTVVRLDWRGLAALGRALPIVVRFDDGQSRVLTRCDDNAAAPQVTLVDPADKDAPQVVGRAAFEARWRGEALLLKVPTALSVAGRPFGWSTLRAMVLSERAILRDLVISTVVLSLLALAPILFAWTLVRETISFHARGTFVFLSVAFAVLVLFEAAFATVRRGLLARLSSHLGMRLDTMIVQRVLRLPVTMFERTPAGLLAHRMHQGTTIRAAIVGPLAGLALDAGVALCVLPVMLSFSIALTVVSLALLLVLALMMLLLMPAHRRAAEALAAAEADSAATLVQTAGGFATIKGLGLERALRQRWDVLVARETRRRLVEADMAGRLQTIARLTERLVVYGAVALGATFAIEADSALTRTALFAFLLLAARLVAPLRDLAPAVRQIDAARVAAVTFAGLANAIPERPAAKRGARLALQGGIAFADVTFSYPDTAAPALRQVSFEAAAGSILGVAGRNGAGKSTVARLLQGLYPDFQGLIKLDGIDLREFDLDHLRASVAVVGSERPVVVGTVRDVIMAAQPDAGDDLLLHATRLVGAENDIAALPHGYDTVLGEGALGLSEGQRQRLAIARALVADPAILILDEATSALDAEAEALLAGNLKRLATGCTVVIVTQRLASLTQADAILVLDQGRMRDIGRHRELLDRCDVYRALWQRQTARPAPPPRPDDRLPRGAHVA